jgi:hypothetical protein
LLVSRSHRLTARTRLPIARMRHLIPVIAPYTPRRADSAAATGRRGRCRPHVTCALSSRCSSLRSSHDSPLSRTPARSCREASCLALPHCHAVAPHTSTPATTGRAAPRRPPRAPPDLGPPPQTIGRRSEPTASHPAPPLPLPRATLHGLPRSVIL